MASGFVNFGCERTSGAARTGRPAWALAVYPLRL
jgi:hypothetical protein